MGNFIKRLHCLVGAVAKTFKAIRLAKGKQQNQFNTADPFLRLVA
jgi:hypothetical protein